MNGWYIAGTVLVAAVGRLAWIAAATLRKAGRTVDRLVAEENAPVRYAAGVAAVPEQQPDGGRQ